MHRSKYGSWIHKLALVFERPMKVGTRRPSGHTNPANALASFYRLSLANSQSTINNVRASAISGNIAFHMAIDMDPRARLHTNRSATSRIVWHSDHTSRPPVANIATIGRCKIKAGMKFCWITTRWRWAIAKWRRISLEIFHRERAIAPDRSTHCNLRGLITYSFWPHSG